MSRRLLFPDALRGFFILNVVWLHALNSLVYGNDVSTADRVNPLVFALLAPVAILATWAPVFLMLSGIVNAYSMHNAVKGLRPEKIDRALGRALRAALANNAMIYLLSVLNMTCLHHPMHYNGALRHTFITGSLRSGTWQSYSPQLLFYNDALATIAITGAVTSIILYLLWRNGGTGKTQRSMNVLIALAAAWVAVSPFLHTKLDAPLYAALDAHYWIKALALKFVIGPNQSPFPNVAYGLLGAVFGIAVSEGVEIQRIRRYGYGTAAVSLSGAAILFIAQGLTAPEVALPTLPIRVHLLNLGLMMCLCTRLIDKVEYQPAARRVVIARKTTGLRRFGMVALSVFLLEGPVAVLLGRIYVPLWNDTGVFPRSAMAIVPFLLLLIAVWNTVLRLWEKVHFQYGFEWAIVNVVGRVRGRKSERLNPVAVLHEPTATAARIE
ncbi:MAG TPA: hypothetical protein PLO37_06820 [Candidatus Hydrogenedentes bacterium]|nr:hypothetical protein [Candidatus Hydrogenedentota bacterium]